MSNDLLQGWARVARIGEGGNGVVYRAKKEGRECALKVLKTVRIETEAYKRFIGEVTVLRQLSEDPGVLPILEAHLPDQPHKRDKAWLSMPIAIPMKVALGMRPRIDSVVGAIAGVAETLARLSRRGIAHRDIKPENLYAYNDRWVVGDFGLADFPEKEDISEEGRALGPRFYIAPEMVRDPLQASGFPADVWSLAKTMWVLATGQNFPPPYPQAAGDPKDSLAVLTSHHRAFQLDNVIERATLKEPDKRLTMSQFASELRTWLTSGISAEVSPEVSDTIRRIRERAPMLFETQDRLTRCRKQAQAITAQLLQDLNPLSDRLAETGLPHNKPSDSGMNLLKGSGLARTNYGEDGVTVSMYTPSHVTHIYLCGLMIQVVDENRHRLYAAHHIEPHKSAIEVVWSEVHEVDSGSEEEQRVVARLVAGLNENLESGLARFLALL